MATARADEAFMRRAFELARLGAGETSPNPVVGCVIVRRGRVVGEGYHARVGGPHAEVVALANAGAAARGATLYVSIEPCSYAARTPACAPHVAASGVRRVVTAVRDPNPRVNGSGLRTLRRAGIEVANGVLRREAIHLNQRFILAAREGRPFILLKAATTLDGRIATRTGDSKWITSVAGRRAARRLRGLHDAVAVGIGTVLADDPLLLPQPRLKRVFHRVVFDSDLRTPPGSQLAMSARRSPVWVLARRDSRARRRALEALGVSVVVQGARGSRVSPEWAMETLWQNGIWSVMVEGGAELLGSFLAARLVDQLAWFRAPKLLGGRSSLSAFGGRGPAAIADALELRTRSRLSGLEGDALVPQTEGLEIWYPR